MSRYDLLKITAKNIGLSLADNLSAGMGSTISNSIKEIQEYSKQTNEALYYLQIKTFLETVDLDQQEINQFFEKNPDNLRLGVEIFKILENTCLEQQAKYIAKAFRKYVHSEITENKFYQYIHVIEKLDRFILTEIQQDIENLELYYKRHKMVRSFDELGIANFRGTHVVSNHNLQTIGFIEVEMQEQTLKVSGIVKPKMKYKRTELYLGFCRDLIEEEQCTE